MTTYYFTFGQDHVHPGTGEAMKDYWIEVVASDANTAREFFVKQFGLKWSHQYTADQFEPSFFPKGCYDQLSTQVGGMS